MTCSPFSPLPSVVHPVLDRYLIALGESRVPVSGAYLYGSLCLGGFDPLSSDIDLLVLTSQILTAEEIDRLRALHAALGDTVPMATRLEIAYLPLPSAMPGQASEIACPVVRDGAFFAAGTGDVNAVSWWQIQHYGLVLHGSSLSSLVLRVSWNAVEAAMHHNLVAYWPARATEPGRFLDDYWVQFAVTTLCRILTTLEDHRMESKDSALERWALRLTPRWHLLLREASRIRHAPDCPSLYRTPELRAHDLQEFLAHVQCRSVGSPHCGREANASDRSRSSGESSRG